MKILSIQDRINLIAAKIEILKLKHNDYQWQTALSEEDRVQALTTLREINDILKADRVDQQK